MAGDNILGQLELVACGLDFRRGGLGRLGGHAAVKLFGHNLLGLFYADFANMGVEAGHEH